jgi:hypothetical protein
VGPQGCTNKETLEASLPQLVLQSSPLWKMSRNAHTQWRRDFKGPSMATVCTNGSISGFSVETATKRGIGWIFSIAFQLPFSVNHKGVFLIHE